MKNKTEQISHEGEFNYHGFTIQYKASATLQHFEDTHGFTHGPAEHSTEWDEESFEIHKAELWSDEDKLDIDPSDVPPELESAEPSDAVSRGDPENPRRA